MMMIKMIKMIDKLKNTFLGFRMYDVVNIFILYCTTKESDRRSATKSAEKEEEEEEEEEEGKEREKRWRTKRRSRNSTRPWNRKQPRTRRSRGCASARRLDDSRLPANKRERLYHW